MGNSIRIFLRKAGCTEHFLNTIFSTNFEHLITAIEKNDLEKVKFYHLIKKLSFSDYLPSGDTPLHVAVSFSHLEIVEYIVQYVRPLNIEDKNFHGDTVLMLATLKGNLQMVRYLIEVGKSNPNTRENRGSTPFFAACCTGNLELIEYYLSELKVDVRTINFDGQSVVHRVAYYGLLPVLKLLRKRTHLGFSSVDKKGNTPLHLAAIRLNITCLRYLLKHSSKHEVLLGQKNLDQETPLSIIVGILNKLKDPIIIDITKDDVLKYIKNKKEFPAITNSDLPSKLRQTLLAGTSEKGIGAGSNKHLRIENLLKPIQPFPDRPSSSSEWNRNISPKTLKINTKREKVLSKVTPLDTDKKVMLPPLDSKTFLGSKTNLNALENSNNEPNQEEKDNANEIKSALVRKRERGRGARKNNSNKSPSPDKLKEKNLGNSSPFNKLKQFFMSPKKKKQLGANTSKPLLTKELTFKEAHELALQESSQRDEENLLGKEKDEERVMEKSGDEEAGPGQIRNTALSVFFKHGLQKSPLNLSIKHDLAGENNGNNEKEKEISTPPNILQHHQKMKANVIDIPEDSPFNVLLKFNEDKNIMMDKENNLRRHFKA